MTDSRALPTGTDYDMIIIGAGFAGLRMLVQARKLGYSAVVLEGGAGIGGTWYWNRYPGARCDVLSADYSYAFSPELEQEWRWSERYATQPEILRYVEFVAAKFDLKKDIQLNTVLKSAYLNEDSNTWSIEDQNGRTLTSTYFVMATGCLSTAKLPDIAGRDSFAGEVYHTAYWPHEAVDFAGKRVGVIGTGSSGTQLIPIVAREAGHLTVFQRTPNFSVPARNALVTDAEDAAIKEDYADRRVRARNSPSGLGVVPNKQSALDASPDERYRHYSSQWETAGFGFVLSYFDLLLNRDANETAAEFIRDRIKGTLIDPAIADVMAPTGYPFGAKRPCVDTGYFETFNRENVTLVDIVAPPIQEITEARVTVNGEMHELDILVFATGFDAMTGSLLRPDIRGRNGQTLEREVGHGSADLPRSGDRGFPEFLLHHRPRQPLAAQQCAAVDRAARRLARRPACRSRGPWCPSHRAGRRR